MTEPETTPIVPEKEQVTGAPDSGSPEATAEPAPPAPEPEPWTPERVIEWNAYYDRFVVFAVLLLALVVACNYLTSSHFFLHLKTGQLIAENGAPVKTDEFSYTEAGRSWVDGNWLFEWAQAGLYGLAYNWVPTDPADITASRPEADRIAVGALGLLNAVVYMLAAWALLRIRHRGPGAWWVAICVALAVGMFWDPVVGLSPGGLASVSGMPEISPVTWGMLFLSLQLLIAFRAFDQGRPGYLWWLIPLYALWANWDISFLTGLLLLAMIVLGHWLDGGLLSWPESEAADAAAFKRGDGEAPAAEPAPRPVSMATALLVLGLCAAACLINPWTYKIYVQAFDPFAQLIWPLENYKSVSFFNDMLLPEVRGWLRGYYLVMVALGVVSFMVNSARFSWRRFLVFAAVSLLWACLIRFSVEFALVLAMVVALNGQEAYLARFGREGRIEATWTIWSTGGRLVTLALVFAAVGLDITGEYIFKPLVHFGLGYHPDGFPIEVAEFLDRHDELKGNVLNTSKEQGDLLVWKAYPKRKTFLDSRRGLFSRELLGEWDKIRGAIRDDDAATWKRLLDKYKITAIMIDPYASDKTFERLKNGLYWIPFYDDGRTIMYGRKDAPASDLAFFKAHVLEPDRVYRLANPVPPVSGPPTPISWMDDLFPNRRLGRNQMRTEAAWRWLRGGAAEKGVNLPDPARCLLAIQDARIALSRNPDDTRAYRVLNEAYRLLAAQETAMLMGIPITAANQAQINMISTSPERLMNRFRQRVTVLNYAIQTTPTPRTPEDRDELFGLNLELFELYASANFVDLARDRLKAALALNPSKDILPEEGRIAMQQRLEQINQFVEQAMGRLDEYDIEQQPKTVDLAMMARQQGLVGEAIKKLVQADENNDSPLVVKPQLLELLCATGQADRALDMLNVSVSDQNLGNEPGYALFRQGLVLYLMGNYRAAANLYEKAILQVRMERSNKAVVAAKNLARGEEMLAVNQFLAIPNSVDQQASWEFDTGMCLLEGGELFQSGDSTGAADHLTRALTLSPDLPVRPIAAYYLEKLGKPVPPPREGAAAAKPAVAGGATVSGAPASSTVPIAPTPPAPPASTTGTAPPEPTPKPASPPEAGKSAEKPAKPAEKAKPAEPARPETTRPASGAPAAPAAKKAEPSKPGS